MSDGPPDHWYDHYPSGGGVNFCLAGDLLEGDEAPLDNPADDELVQLCGSCGHRLLAFHSGYAGEAESFKEAYCPNCFTANFRWTSVVATRWFAKEVDSDGIQRYIANRHDARAWCGEIATVESEAPQVLVEELPDPPEVAKVPLADIGIGWDIRCPSCGIEPGSVEFDFHHWDYQNDTGCQLCRDCHSHIHRDLHASAQRRETGDDWEKDAVKRLLSLSKSNGLEFSTSTEFVRRFNIPSGSTADKATSKQFAKRGEGVPLTELMADE